MTNYFLENLSSKEDILDKNTNMITIPITIKKAIVEFIDKEPLLEECMSVLNYLNQSLMGIFGEYYECCDKCYDDGEFRLNDYFRTDAHIIESIFLALWDYELRGWHKHRLMSNFMTKHSIVDGIVANFNSVYQGEIISALNKFDEYMNFVKIFNETYYPPIFMNKKSVNVFNKLFSDVYYHCHAIMSEDMFIKQFYELIDTELIYLRDMILTGINTAKENGENVLRNLYVHCCNEPNVLKLQETFILENCPTNPNSRYFFQVINHRLYKNYYKNNGFVKSSSLNKKIYTSYVNNFYEFMMVNIDLTIDDFVKSSKKYYYSSVTVPINSNILNDYIKVYYEFLKRN